MVRIEPSEKEDMEEKECRLRNVGRMSFKDSYMQVGYVRIERRFVSKNWLLKGYPKEKTNIRRRKGGFKWHRASLSTGGF